MMHINSKSTWLQHGVTAAGGQGKGSTLHQLSHPSDVVVDQHGTVIVSDWMNSRIVEWKIGATDGQVVAGGKESGNRLDQLNGPMDIMIDDESNSLLICDRGNRRVVRWGRNKEAANAEILIENVACRGLSMDKYRNLYVSDIEKHEVRRYGRNDPVGVVVAGGYGSGDRLNQLSWPCSLHVDDDGSIFVSDWNNHRIMKWERDAKEGTIVAGGRGDGRAVWQLSHPVGLHVDSTGTVYVADAQNARIMRWCRGASEGSVAIGDQGRGVHSNQLSNPQGICIGKEGQMYVVDEGNHRVQLFQLDANS